MEVVAAVAAIAVGAALIVAGIFKLVDRPTWITQAADLGVPALVARAVPVVEVVLGVALVVPVARPWPAVVAVALLIAFSAVVVRRLLDGARPPCACYGSRSRRPLGLGHFVRNVGLVALATIAAVWG